MTAASTPLSRAQQGKLHAVLTQLGITDRADKLRVVGATVYREIGSTNELTWHEASVAITTLSSIAQIRDDPREAIDRMVGIAERLTAVSS